MGLEFGPIFFSPILRGKKGVEKGPRSVSHLFLVIHSPMAKKSAPRRLDLDSALSKPFEALFASESVAQKYAFSISQNPTTVLHSVEVTPRLKPGGGFAWLVRWKSNKK